MKLYEISNRFTDFKLKANQEIKVPPASHYHEIDQIYTFLKLDGMYCACKGQDGKDYYFAAWTEVNLINK